MNVYFLRHGETEENNKGVYYGKKDIYLNEKGKKQCELAGKMLKNISFDKVYVSERKRTHQSAGIILKDFKKDLTVDRRLNERSFGIFEGMAYAEIQQKYPVEWEKWEGDWIGYQLPGGECYADFFKRVQLFIKDLEKLDYKNILIVTHGGVIRAACCVILENMKLYWKFASRNADVSVLKYEYGNWFIDSITHIEEME